MDGSDEGNTSGAKYSNGFRVYVPLCRNTHIYGGPLSVGFGTISTRPHPGSGR
jgi:hypothetical protein